MMDPRGSACVSNLGYNMNNKIHSVSGKSLAGHLSGFAGMYCMTSIQLRNTELDLTAATRNQQTTQAVTPSHDTMAEQ
jgi:hypothetical protein